MKNVKSLSPPLLQLHIQKQHVIYSGGRRQGKGAYAPGTTFQVPQMIKVILMILVTFTPPLVI